MNQETAQIIDKLTTNSLDPAIAATVLRLEIDRQTSKFDGFMAATELSIPGTKTPRPKQISYLTKRLLEVNQEIATNQSGLNTQAENVSQEYGIPLEQAIKLIQTASIISQETLAAGLTYRDKPFNLAILPPREIDRLLADNIAQLTYQALMATQQLIQSDPTARFLVEKGSTQLERDLNRFIPTTSAPLNRMDLISGKIIEFGPTYTDGFGTADTLAQIWGIRAQSIKTLADTLKIAYAGKKEKPSVGLAYIGDSMAMLPELEIVRQGLETDGGFDQVSTCSFEQAISLRPDLLYFYFKPSMLDRLGYTFDDINGLLNCTTLVPPFNEQLGKKVILNMFFSYKDYYQAALGQENYRSLISLVAPTSLITPDTPIPDYECVIKPSSGGSNDGVIDNNDPNFVATFNMAQRTFQDPYDDAWIQQPKLKDQLSLAFGSQNGSLVKLTSPNIRTVLLTGLNNQGKPVAAGGFAATDSTWVIADNGFNFPIKLKGGNQ